MFLLILIVVLFFSFFVLLFVLTYINTMEQALRKYIKPALEEKGLLYIDYKWPGLFSDGDFNETDFTITVMNNYGSASYSHYAYIYYKVGGETKKTTVRIDTTFWVIKKVTYSSEL